MAARSVGTRCPHGCFFSSSFFSSLGGAGGALRAGATCGFGCAGRAPCACPATGAGLRGAACGVARVTGLGLGFDSSFGARLGAVAALGGICKSRGLAITVLSRLGSIDCLSSAFGSAFSGRAAASDSVFAASGFAASGFGLGASDLAASGFAFGASALAASGFAFGASGFAASGFAFGA